MARRIDSIDSVVSTEVAPEWPFDSTLLTSLARIVSEWTSLSAQATIAQDAGLAIDPSDVTALFILGRLGPQRPSVLAHRLRVSPPTVSKIVGRLAARGILRRQADPDDARATIVVLTTLGIRSAQQLFAQGDKMMDELLADWSASDAAVLTRLLARFADRIDEVAAESA